MAALTKDNPIFLKKQNDNILEKELGIKKM